MAYEAPILFSCCDNFLCCPDKIQEEALNLSIWNFAETVNQNVNQTKNRSIILRLSSG